MIVTPGVVTGAPNGFVASNLDPALNSTYNNEIYDPNFLPGFESGLTNTTVSWSSGDGYANLGYSIGPWVREETTSLPHFAAGPQCCNFVEVPHTQQFRRVEWGDYYYVRAGLGSPGINLQNYTAVFGAPPTAVGLRTDWDWTVQFSFNWIPPVMMDKSNEWAAIGIATTQYVPSVPGNLVYTLVNFWMDSNSSNHLTAYSDGIKREIAASNVVVYHPMQISGLGNESVTLNISPYLEDTLQSLGIQNSQNQPPLITYIYLNVEGYNFSWNTTLLSFWVMSPSMSSPSQILYLLVPLVLGATAGTLALFFVLKQRAIRKTALRDPARV